MSEHLKRNIAAAVITTLFVGLVMVAPVAYVVSTVSMDEASIQERAIAEQARLDAIYAQARINAHGPSGRPR